METEIIVNAAENSISSGQNNDFFDTSHLTKDLKGRSVRGGMVTVTAQGLKFFLQLGSTAVLARILTPQDYGLIAMVAVVMNFAMMFKDMGLSMATVQKAEINHGQISNLFWFNVVVSFCLFIVVVALSPVVAWFYGEPRLTAITMALACSFIFGGLTVQHQALLRRQMAFGKLALLEISAMTGGVAVAIITALLGARYWALVYMQLGNALVMVVGVWFACNWRPTMPKRGTGVRPMLAFGGHLTGFNFVNYFARNLDKILIGKACGSGALGMYNKAYQLLLLPLNQIRAPMSAVFISALSHIQNDPERYRRVFFRAMRVVCLVMLSPMPVLIMGSDWVIQLILGPQWADASRIFTCLSVVAVVQVALICPSWLFITQGRGKDMLYCGIICSVISVISFVVGLPWGVFGVALAYSISGILLRTPVYLFWVGRRGPVGTKQIIGAIAPFAVVVCINCLVLFAFRHYSGIVEPVFGVVLLTTLTLCTTALTAIFMPTIRSTVVEIKDLVRGTLRA